MTKAQTIKVDLKSELSEISRLTAALDAFLGSLGLSQKIAFQSTLVLDELLTNVISYSKAKVIHVEAAFEDGLLRFLIKDDGIAFNPLEQASKPDLDASLEERKIGGLGVHITKELMDDVHYRHKGAYNILTLVKKTGTEKS